MSLLGRLFGLDSGPVAMAADTSGTADPAKWLLDIFGGMMTTTGIRVTPEIALTIPGVAACVNVLSEDLAKVPLVLYRRKRERGKIVGKEPATDHPLYRLLHDRPSPWMTSFNWRRAMVAAAMTRSDSFSRVHRNRRGDVAQIRLVRPGATMMRWTEEGEPFFDISSLGEQFRYSYQEVLHLPYRADMIPGQFGGIRGVSPIQRHAETIALAVAAEKFAAAFFKNGARPSAVIEFEGKLPNDAVAQRVRDGLERAYAGVDNAFKIAILELGMKLKEFSFSNADSQLVEVRKESAVAVAQMFGIPPHKVGILDKATFSNIENQAIEYVTGPVSALAKSFESAMEVSCLTSLEQEDYFIEHDLNGLLRGDIASRYRAYSIGRQWGWLNADEVREFENMNPIGGEQGTSYITPANITGRGGSNGQDDDPSHPNGRPMNSNMGEKSSSMEGETPFNRGKYRLSSLVSPSGERLMIEGTVQ